MVLNEQNSRQFENNGQKQSTGGLAKGSGIFKYRLLYRENTLHKNASLTSLESIFGLWNA